MTLRLPDPRGSRAVLIGTSRYDSDLRDLLAVRNNLEVLQELLTSDTFGGFLSERCTVVQDAPDPRSVCATLREAAMTATDTLLVYFSGHGVLKRDLTLHLALPGTDESDLRWTSIPFEEIREILEESPCPNKILVLDCCNSGRVLDTLMGTRAEPDDIPTIRGTHILTSSANAPSYAPVGERYTAFTGELIRLLRDGLPNGPDLLSLSTLYDPLASSLARRGYPQPRQQSSDGHARLGLVRNRAASQHAGTVVGDGTAADREGTPVDSPARGEIRFKPSHIYHRVRTWAIGGPIVVGCLTAAKVVFPDKDKSLDLYDWRHTVATLLAMGGIVLLGALRKRHPADYSLVLSPDGVEVQYGTSEHFSYPWHRISRCWLRQRPPDRLHGSRYELMVRPMPGVLPQTASRRSPGPHQDDTEGTLRFADLRRLRTTPEAVEAALALYAGTAWTPSPDLVAHPAPSTAQEQVFTANRRVLAAMAVSCAVLGYATAPLGVFVRPWEIPTAWTGLVVCTFFLTTAWFAASRCVRPVQLTVGAAGLALIRGELKIAYAWTEIERIAVVNWPRGVRYPSVLVIRPTGSGEGMIDRTNILLPKLVPGALTLCLLLEVTHDSQLLKAALLRFADEEQMALPSEAWLRTPPGTPALPVTGRTFRGRQPAGVSTLVGAALFAPFCVSVLVADRTPPDWLPVVDNMPLFPLFAFGLTAYFLTGRHHVHLHVGPGGLTLRAWLFGRRHLHVPWGDTDRIGIVASADPEEHALVLWPRHGAVVPPRALAACQASACRTAPADLGGVPDQSAPRRRRPGDSPLRRSPPHPYGTTPPEGPEEEVTRASRLCLRAGAPLASRSAAVRRTWVPLSTLLQITGRVCTVLQKNAADSRPSTAPQPTLPRCVSCGQQTDRAVPAVTAYCDVPTCGVAAISGRPQRARAGVDGPQSAQRSRAGHVRWLQCLRCCRRVGLFCVGTIIATPTPHHTKSRTTCPKTLPPRASRQTMPSASRTTCRRTGPSRSACAPNLHGCRRNLSAWRRANRF
ncbi:caspase family protein [Streptomyces bacillaris]|uniref:caspase, EACC1-associated type n=1 Tax=Streptomyces bacillaris TaxID=68179 RepID=UPI00335652EC